MPIFSEQASSYDTFDQKSARFAQVEKPILCHSRDEFAKLLKFQVPHPLDLVFNATVPVLEEYNKQTLHHEVDPLLIEALSIAPTLCYACDTTPAVHCFVRHDPFVKVQLKLVCDLDAGWAAGTVMVRQGERWRPLREWLRTLPAPSMKGHRKIGWEAQYQWWRSTGRPFRFLDLPKELQRQVLLFAIGEYIELQYHEMRTEAILEHGSLIEHSKKLVTLTTGTRSTEIRRRTQRDPTALPLMTPVNLGLLVLNKESSTMAIDVLYGDTTKSFRTPPLDYEGAQPGLLDNTIEWVPSRYLRFMRRIQLSFTNTEYMQMFDILLPGLGSLEFHRTGYPPQSAAVLKQLPNLKYLGLHFNSTANGSYDPWFHEVLPEEVRDEYLEKGINYNRLPCQKVLTDWIICYATEHIKHIPTVELTGFIKASTKKKWEAILGGKRLTDYTEAVTDQKQAIRAMPSTDFPPQCFCPKQCGDFDLRWLQRRLYCTCGASSTDDRCGCRSPKPQEWKEGFGKYWFDHNDEYVPPPPDSWGTGVEPTEVRAWSGSRVAEARAGSSSLRGTGRVSMQMS